MQCRTFLLDGNLQYKEKKLNHPVFDRYYEMENPQNVTYPSVPDGSFDLQAGITKDDRVSVELVGSNLTGRPASTAKFTRCFGIKFRRSVAPELGEWKAEDFINERKDLTDILQVRRDQVRELLILPSKAEEKISFLENVFEEGKQVLIDETARYMVRKIEEADGNVDVEDLVRSTGYSHRSCNRIFKESTGFSMKRYANMIRMQKSMQILQAHPQEKNYQFLEELGFYDQAHFIHSFKNFTTVTPTAYLEFVRTGMVV